MALRHRESTVAIDRATDSLAGGSGLPALLTRLVGRDDSIVTACGLVEKSRLVTLTGPGGIGKTQLALAIGHRLAGRFGDAVAFIELAPVIEHNFVLPTVATALGLWDTAVEPIEQRLTTYLRERRLLLILDNLEHLLDAAPGIATLLAACPQLHVLVTSRSPLHLRSEHTFDVPPLAIPLAGRPLSGEVLADYSAVNLFVTQAQAADASFALTDSNAGTIAAICARLDGIPLAIELAASRIKVLSPAGILDRLDEQLLLLTGGPRDQPARLQTMRSAIAWSYDLLDAGQQRFFRRLAVFSGGWTLDAAAAVGEPEDDVLEAMASLIGCSLVRRSASLTSADRFIMLEPIRQFAFEHLVASGEADAIRSRHADVFLTLAEQAAPHLDWSDQPVWMNRLDGEHDNFRSAMSWLYQRRDVERGLRFIGALCWFWNIRGFFSEARTRAQEFLSLSEASGRSSERARALGALAYSLYFIGDYQQAQDVGEEALAINDETGDRSGRARILIPLLSAAFDSGDDRRHLLLSDDLLHTARDLGDQENIARALTRLGLAAMRSGDTQRAAALYGESLELAERLKNRATTALALGSLGDVYFRAGDLVRATAAYRRSLATYVDIRYARPIIVGLERLAAVAHARAQTTRAVRLYAAAAARCEVIGIGFPVSSPDAVNSDFAALRAELGDEQFQSTWYSGHSMSFTDVIACALETEPSPTSERPPAVGNLSPRECDVLRLIAAGQSNKQIAAELYLSVHTIERHITNLYAKIGARGRADATAWALRHDLG